MSCSSLQSDFERIMNFYNADEETVATPRRDMKHNFLKKVNHKKFVKCQLIQDKRLVHEETKHVETKHEETKHEETKHEETKHEETEHGETEHEETEHEETENEETKHVETKHEETKHEETEHEETENEENQIDAILKDEKKLLKKFLDIKDSREKRLKQRTTTVELVCKDVENKIEKTERKLKQKWRIFGKRNLRIQLSKYEYARGKYVKMLNNIKVRLEFELYSIIQLPMQHLNERLI